VIKGDAHDGQPGDDSRSQASSEGGVELEAGLLAELRAALAEHEISSEVREDLAVLAVTTRRPGSCLWVFVGFDGRYFSWNKADLQHPVRDIPGAARRIAEQVNEG
jgi:hypothetical protein